MKRLTALFVILLVGICGVSAARAAAVGTITKAAGRVDITAPGRTRVPAAVGDEVHQGDVIRTKSGSSAEITFVDGGVMRLGPKSRVEISEYAVEEKKVKRGLFKLFRGKIQNVVRKIAGIRFGHKRQNRLEVHTPTAVCGVRGTDFYSYYVNGISGFSFDDGQGYGFPVDLEEAVADIATGKTMLVTGSDQPPVIRPATPLDFDLSYLPGDEGGDGAGGDEEKDGKTDPTGGLGGVDQPFELALDDGREEPPPPPEGVTFFETPIGGDGWAGTLSGSIDDITNFGTVGLVGAFTTPEPPPTGVWRATFDMGMSSGEQSEGLFAGILGSWRGLMDTVYVGDGEIGYLQGSLAGEFDDVSFEFAGEGPIWRLPAAATDLTPEGLGEALQPMDYPLPLLGRITVGTPIDPANPGVTVTDQEILGVDAAADGPRVVVWAVETGDGTYANPQGLTEWFGLYGGFLDDGTDEYYLLGDVRGTDDLAGHTRISSLFDTDIFSDPLVDDFFDADLAFEDALAIFTQGGLVYMDEDYLGRVHLNYRGVYDTGGQEAYRSIGSGTLTLDPLLYRGDWGAVGTLYVNDDGSLVEAGQDEGLFGSAVSTPWDDATSELFAMGHYDTTTGTDGPFLFNTTLAGHDPNDANRRLSGFAGGFWELPAQAGQEYPTIFGSGQAIYLDSAGSAGFAIAGQVQGITYPEAEMWSLLGEWDQVPMDPLASPGSLQETTGQFASSGFAGDFDGVGTIQASDAGMGQTLYWAPSGGVGPGWGLYDLKLESGTSGYTGSPGDDTAWDALTGGTGTFARNTSTDGFWLATVQGTWDADGVITGFMGEIPEQGDTFGRFVTHEYVGTLGGPFYGLFTETVTGEGTWVGESLGPYEGVATTFSADVQGTFFNTSGDYTGLTSPSVTGILGGIDPLLAGSPIAAMGEYAAGQDESMLAARLDGGYDDAGLFTGFMVGPWDGAALEESRIRGVYLGSLGWLEGDFSVSAYPGLNMWEIQTGSLGEPSEPGVTAVTAQIGGGVSGTVTGAAWDLFADAGAPGGLWLGNLDGTVTDIPTGPWSAGAGGVVGDVAFLGELGHTTGWSDGRFDADVTGLEYLTPEALGSFSGQLLGVYDGTDWSAAGIGTYTESDLFLAAGFDGDFYVEGNSLVADGSLTGQMGANGDTSEITEGLLIGTYALPEEGTPGLFGLTAADGTLLAGDTPFRGFMAGEWDTAGIDDARFRGVHLGSLGHVTGTFDGQVFDDIGMIRLTEDEIDGIDIFSSIGGTGGIAQLGDDVVLDGMESDLFPNASGDAGLYLASLEGAYTDTPSAGDQDLVGGHGETVSYLGTLTWETEWTGGEFDASVTGLEYLTETSLGAFDGEILGVYDDTAQDWAAAALGTYTEQDLLLSADVTGEFHWSGSVAGGGGLDARLGATGGIEGIDQALVLGEFTEGAEPAELFSLTALDGEVDGGGAFRGFAAGQWGSTTIGDASFRGVYQDETLGLVHVTGGFGGQVHADLGMFRLSDPTDFTVSAGLTGDGFDLRQDSTQVTVDAIQGEMFALSQGGGLYLASLEGTYAELPTGVEQSLVGGYDETTPPYLGTVNWDTAWTGDTFGATVTGLEYLTETSLGTFDGQMLGIYDASGTDWVASALGTYVEQDLLIGAAADGVFYDATSIATGGFGPIDGRLGIAGVLDEETDGLFLGGFTHETGVDPDPELFSLKMADGTFGGTGDFRGFALGSVDWTNGLIEEAYLRGVYLGSLGHVVGSMRGEIVAGISMLRLSDDDGFSDADIGINTFGGFQAIEDNTGNAVSGGVSGIALDLFPLGDDTFGMALASIEGFYNAIPTSDGWEGTVGGMYFGGEDTVFFNGDIGSTTPWENGFFDAAVDNLTFMSSTALGTYSGSLLGVYDGGAWKAAALGDYDSDPLMFAATVGGEDALRLSHLTRGAYGRYNYLRPFGVDHYYDFEYYEDNTGAWTLLERVNSTEDFYLETRYDADGAIWERDDPEGDFEWAGAWDPATEHLENLVSTPPMPPMALLDEESGGEYLFVNRLGSLEGILGGTDSLWLDPPAPYDPVPATVIGYYDPFAMESGEACVWLDTIVSFNQPLDLPVTFDDPAGAFFAFFGGTLDGEDLAAGLSGIFIDPDGYAGFLQSTLQDDTAFEGSALADAGTFRMEGLMARRDPFDTPQPTTVAAEALETALWFGMGGVDLYGILGTSGEVYAVGSSGPFMQGMHAESGFPGFSSFETIALEGEPWGIYSATLYGGYVDADPGAATWMSNMGGSGVFGSRAVDDDGQSDDHGWWVTASESPWNDATMTATVSGYFVSESRMGAIDGEILGTHHEDRIDGNDEGYWEAVSLGTWEGEALDFGAALSSQENGFYSASEEGYGDYGLVGLVDDGGGAYRLSAVGGTSQYGLFSIKIGETIREPAASPTPPEGGVSTLWSYDLNSSWAHFESLDSLLSGFTGGLTLPDGSMVGSAAVVGLDGGGNAVLLDSAAGGVLGNWYTGIEMFHLEGLLNLQAGISTAWEPADVIALDAWPEVRLAGRFGFGPVLLPDIEGAGGGVHRIFGIDGIDPALPFGVFQLTLFGDYANKPAGIQDWVADAGGAIWSDEHLPGPAAFYQADIGSQWLPDTGEINGNFSGTVLSTTYSGTMDGPFSGVYGESGSQTGEGYWEGQVSGSWEKTADLNYSARVYGVAKDNLETEFGEVFGLVGGDGSLIASTDTAIGLGELRPGPGFDPVTLFLLGTGSVDTVMGGAGIGEDVVFLGEVNFAYDLNALPGDELTVDSSGVDYLTLNEKGMLQIDQGAGWQGYNDFYTYMWRFEGGSISRGASPEALDLSAHWGGPAASTLYYPEYYAGSDTVGLATVGTDTGIAGFIDQGGGYEMLAIGGFSMTDWGYGYDGTFLWQSALTDGGALAGQLHGFSGGIWNSTSVDGTLDGVAVALFNDGTDAGIIVEANVDGQVYPELGMWRAEDGGDMMEAVSLDDASLGFTITQDPLAFHAAAGTAGDIQLDAAAGNGAFVSIDGSSNWGIWHTEMFGQYTGTIGNDWELHLANSVATADRWAEVVGDRWQEPGTFEPGEMEAAVAGAWMSIDDAATGVMGGTLKGIFDPTDGTWAAVAMGGFVEAATFLDMGREQLEALNIPAVEVGQVDLAGSDGGLTITMDDVAFFSYSTGASPRVWATENVSGSFDDTQTNYYGQTVTLTDQASGSAGFTASVDFEVTQWGDNVNAVVVNDVWAASITSDTGTFTDNGANSSNVSIEGGATGTITAQPGGPPSGLLSGSGAGVVRKVP